MDITRFFVTDFLRLYSLLLPFVIFIQLGLLIFLRILTITFSSPPPSFIAQGSSRIGFVSAKVRAESVAGFELQIHRPATVAGVESFPRLIPKTLLMVH